MPMTPQCVISEEWVNLQTDPNVLSDSQLSTKYSQKAPRPLLLTPINTNLGMDK